MGDLDLMSDEQLKAASAASAPRNLTELQAMSKDQLIAAHDAIMVMTRMDSEDYRDELNRRSVKAATDASTRLAWLVVVLTVVQVALVVYEVASRAP